MHLQNIKKKDRDSFKKIARNTDTSMRLFLSKEIRKITESYPEEMKKPKPKEKCAKIKMPSMSPKVQKDFETIAKNKGLTPSQLLTLHSCEIISSYPDWMIRFEE